MKCPFVPESFSKSAVATAELPLSVASFVFDQVAELVQFLNLSESDVVGIATEPEWKFSGVYFIVKDNKVVYVGQAINVYTRLPRGHHVYSPGKGFKVAFLCCPEFLLDLVESYYIHKFTPALTRGAPLAASNGKLQRELLKAIREWTSTGLMEVKVLFDQIGQSIPEERPQEIVESECEHQLTQAIRQPEEPASACA
jgi:hypothetical protein